MEQKKAQKKDKLSEKLTGNNEELINKLVDEKISKMMPGIIKQVVKTV